MVSSGNKPEKLQFSLQTLLLLIVIVALAVGWAVDRKQIQPNAVNGAAEMLSHLKVGQNVNAKYNQSGGCQLTVYLGTKGSERLVEIGVDSIVLSSPVTGRHGVVIKQVIRLDTIQSILFAESNQAATQAATSNLLR